jgi:hypothetical protein
LTGSETQSNDSIHSHVLTIRNDGSSPINNISISIQHPEALKVAETKPSFVAQDCIEPRRESFFVKGPVTRNPDSEFWPLYDVRVATIPGKQYYQVTFLSVVDKLPQHDVNDGSIVFWITCRYYYSLDGLTAQNESVYPLEYSPVTREVKLKEKQPMVDTPLTWQMRFN